MTNEKVDKAKRILYNETPADRIIDTYVDREYVEFTCSAGGDVMVFRIYNNGSIVEK